MTAKTHPKFFFTEDESTQIVDQIRKIESETTGKIKIHLEGRCPITDPLSRSIKLFYGHGLNRHIPRNAVLIYFATHYRLFAVVGDQALSKSLAPNFWAQLEKLMGTRFRESKFFEGTKLALEEIRTALKRTFPRRNPGEPR